MYSWNGLLRYCLKNNCLKNKDEIGYCLKNKDETCYCVKT